MDTPNTDRVQGLTNTDLYTKTKDSVHSLIADYAATEGTDWNEAVYSVMSSLTAELVQTEPAQP